MILKTQRRLAARILKIGKNRVWFDPIRLDEIKEAITNADLRSLIKDKAIQKMPAASISRFRIRKKLIQKRKGRRTGLGSRKGKRTARLPSKRSWMLKIRAQRTLLKSIKQKNLIKNETYRDLYKKAKGGFFRSRSHIILYLNENKLFLKKNGKK